MSMPFSAIRPDGGRRAENEGTDEHQREGAESRLHGCLTGSYAFLPARLRGVASFRSRSTKRLPAKAESKPVQREILPLDRRNCLTFQVSENSASHRPNGPDRPTSRLKSGSWRFNRSTFADRLSRSVRL
jgi:hypothetical protein